MAVAVDAAREAATGSAWAGVMRAVSFLVKIGIIAGLSSTMVVNMMAQPRILMSMSHDRLLPAWAGRIHPRFRTPWISSIVVGFFVAIFAGALSFQTLGQMTSIGTLLAFVIVCAGVWRLRVRRPDLERPFKAPLVPLVPILGMVISFGLMASLPPSTWIRLIVWLILGLGIYFGYGRKNSRLGRMRASGD